MAVKGSDAPAPKSLKCANCGAASSADYRPFCSKRCADADLGRWLTGSYAIAGDTGSDEDGGRPDEPPETLPEAPKRR